MTERKRILVGEDDEALGGLFDFILKSVDRFVAELVDTGCRAVTAARHFIPDLIFLDLDLPGTASKSSPSSVPIAPFHSPFAAARKAFSSARVNARREISPTGALST